MILKNTCSNIKITTLTTANYKIQRPNNKYEKKNKTSNKYQDNIGIGKQNVGEYYRRGTFRIQHCG